METSWGPLNLLQSLTHFYKNISKNVKMMLLTYQKTVYEKLIEIMGKHMQDEIVN